MRRTAIILLPVLLAVSTFHRETVHLLFLLNRSYIVQNLCVGRDTPETLCGGSCVLGETLDDHATDRSGDPVPPTIRESGREVIDLEEVRLPDASGTLVRRDLSLEEDPWTPRENASDIFHPPRG